MTHTLHETEYTTDTPDDYVSDDARKHRARLTARDQLVRAVDCPRCGQVAMTPCVGTGDDERHAGEFLDFHHVERLQAASAVY